VESLCKDKVKAMCCDAMLTPSDSKAPQGTNTLDSLHQNVDGSDEGSGHGIYELWNDLSKKMFKQGM
jgi:hypothetical protein